MQTYDIMPRVTVEQIVHCRNEAISLYDQAWQALEVAQKAVSKAEEMALRVHPGTNSYNANHSDEIKDFFAVIKLPSRDKYTRVARKIIDISAWSWIIERTDLERLMDKQAKDELREQMRYVPDRVDPHTHKLINADEIARGLPELTVENVQSTLQGFLAESQTIFKRGIANAFSKLDRRFKSHDGFKVGSRVILERAFNEHGSWSWRSHHRDTLIDIERTFSVLDGKDEKAFTAAIGAIDASRSGWSPHQSEADTDYFKIRIFKNGNAHLWFKRDDLVQRVNQLLAEYYGEVLGDKEQAEDDPLFNVKTTPARYYGFFPTPDEAAAKVIEATPLQWTRGKPPMRILEPSAGTGNLALPLTRQVKGWDPERREEFYHQPLVDCIEIQPNLADALHTRGIFRKVICADFLNVRPEETGLYDRIVMNPPFDRERDIDHVIHALKFLTPQGSLVAIMSAGTEFRDTRKSKAFRKLMKDKGARLHDLPPGSFASVGTYVNTVYVVVHNQGAAARWSGGRAFEVSQ